MIVFNVNRYSDFDIPVTVLTMVAPAGTSNAMASMLAKEAQTLFSDTDDADKAQKYLESWGFKAVKTYDVTIGGNL
jgi:hypothetical protein